MLKKPLTFEEQIEQLKSHGIIIQNEEDTTERLRRVSYYKISGYAIPFRKAPEISDYENGTTFEKIYTLYVFDAAYRDLLRKYLEITEVYYKTQIAHWFSLCKCTMPPHDQHYDRRNYYRKHDFDQIIDNFDNQERHYYSDSLIVKHHNSKYGGKMPLWVITELLSFSNTSKLYSAMYPAEQDVIAAAVGVGRATLINHLHCLSVLRNRCAHGARLYNTTLYPSVKLTPQFLRKHPEVLQDTVFAYTLMLLRRLPNTKQQKIMLTELEKLLKNYDGKIELSKIGFPINYHELLSNSIK